jgi:hypothetical protein
VLGRVDRRSVFRQKWLHGGDWELKDGLKKLERAKGFEPSTQNSQASDLEAVANLPKAGYTQIRAQFSEDGELNRLCRLWARVPVKVRAAVLSLVDSVANGEEEDDQ